jgi:hypothetical protein
MKWPAIVLCCILLATPVGARADEPSPAAIAKAKEMLASGRAVQTMNAMLDPIAENVETIIEAANPGCAQQINDIIRKYFTPEFRKRLPEVVDGLAIIWACHFTIDEMDKLIAFNRTDLGQKLIALEPQIFQESVIAGRVFGQNLAREVYEKIRPELKNQGLKAPNI